MNFYEYETDEIDLLESVTKHISKRQYDKALECINGVNSFEITDPLIMMSKAQCYLRLDERTKANETYEKAIELCDEKLKEKKVPFILNIKGNCYLLLKNYQKAIE